jgi:MFS family permease
MKPLPHGLLSHAVMGATVALALISSVRSAGTFFGVIIAGDLADYFGRRITIISGCLIFTVSCIFQVASNGLGLIVARRLISGFGLGFISAISFSTCPRLPPARSVVLRLLGPVLAWQPTRAKSWSLRSLLLRHVRRRVGSGKHKSGSSSSRDRCIPRRFIPYDTWCHRLRLPVLRHHR